MISVGHQLRNKTGSRQIGRKETFEVLIFMSTQMTSAIEVVSPEDVAKSHACIANSTILDGIISGISYKTFYIIGEVDAKLPKRQNEGQGTNGP